MAMRNYRGKAFVAFIDISGFKKMMKTGKALECLGDFYQIGYDMFNGNTDSSKFDALFVSDSGILIGLIDNCEMENKEVRVLEELLNLVREINVKMVNKGWTLTTSIAYGNYVYEGRIELSNIQKTPIYGDAYVKAFLDSESENRLKQGECRIVLEEDGEDSIDSIIDRLPNSLKRLILKKGRDNNHRYFYWQLNDEKKIKEYDAEYKKADEAVYEKRTEIIRRYVDLVRNENFED